MLETKKQDAFSQTTIIAINRVRQAKRVRGRKMRTYG